MKCNNNTASTNQTLKVSTCIPNDPFCPVKPKNNKSGHYFMNGRRKSGSADGIGLGWIGNRVGLGRIG